jgi:osmoprotectant transport system ATP-binding protein
MATGSQSEKVIDATAPILEAFGLVKSYGGTRALDDVSLVVGAGECVALVGESGAGKTTLLRCFNRLVEPDRGTVRVFGRDAGSFDPSSLRRRIGYVPQEGGLIPHWRVLKNVALVPRLLGLGCPTQLARKALDQVGLAPGTYADRWPRELSGGQRQRVAFARAIAAHSRLVLLDEPFGALDAITREDLVSAFAHLCSELSLSTVLVTHDLGVARRLANRIAVMRNGHIVQLDSWRALQLQPATDYVRDLLRRAGLGP